MIFWKTMFWWLHGVSHLGYEHHLKEKQDPIKWILKKESVVFVNYSSTTSNPTPHCYSLKKIWQQGPVRSIGRTDGRKVR